MTAGWVVNDDDDDDVEGPGEDIEVDGDLDGDAGAARRPAVRARRDALRTVLALVLEARVALELGQVERSDVAVDAAAEMLLELVGGMPAGADVVPPRCGCRWVDGRRVRVPVCRVHAGSGRG
ncbi:MAG: hypothetical protein JWP11_3421 [Frankiales bacterium]|nr:hypothetical protein [Frankiales bacterium]